MTTPQVILDTRKLDRIARRSGQAADEIVGELAFMFQADVNKNWSTSSPSAPGEPPGVDTGTLKNANYVERVQDKVWRWLDGTDYGIHLEFGTRNMAARPFVRPAIERIAQEAKRRGILEKIVR